MTDEPRQSSRARQATEAEIVAGTWLADAPKVFGDEKELAWRNTTHAFLTKLEAEGLLTDEDVANEVRKGATRLIEPFIASLPWSERATEHEKALVAGNIRNFWQWLIQNSRGRITQHAVLSESAGPKYGGECADLKVRDGSQDAPRSMEGRAVPQWVSCADRQPDIDGVMWFIFERNGDRVDVTAEYYHFFEGWATDSEVLAWWPERMVPPQMPRGERNERA